MSCCKAFARFYNEFEGEFVDKIGTYRILLEKYHNVWGEMTYCPFCGSKLKVSE